MFMSSLIQIHGEINNENVDNNENTYLLSQEIIKLITLIYTTLRLQYTRLIYVLFL